MEATKLSLLIFFVSFAALVPTLRANIGEFDEVLQKKAEQARLAALEAYTPNPEEVTEHLNLHVRMWVWSLYQFFDSFYLFLFLSGPTGLNMRPMAKFF